jgi:hypothetical protein
VAKLTIEGPLALVFYLSRAETTRAGLQAGDTVRITFPPEAVHVFRPVVL